MESKNLVTLSLLLMISGLPSLSFSQPTLSGELTGALGPGTFIVVGNCSVPTGANLTISPGTTLLFSGYFKLEVYGQLNADGTIEDSIFFLRQYPTEECKHGGIRFWPGASQDNSLIYCHIDYAENVLFPDCFGGAVLCWEAGVIIMNCSITNSRAAYGGGIYVVNSTATVEFCTLTGCSAQARGGAIYTINSTIIISNCQVVNNVADLVAGICIYNNPDATVRNCVIAHNTATSVAG